MLDAHVTSRNLADRCAVDIKTVERWLQDEARVPHLRHRWSAAEALGVETAVLWPDAIRNTVKTGPDREVLTVYPYRSACPKSVWRNLISAAGSEIVFAGYPNYFLWLEHPNLAKLVGHDSPILHLRQHQADGLFDRFAYHASELWSSGRDVWADESSGRTEEATPHGFGADK